MNKKFSIEVFAAKDYCGKLTNLDGSVMEFNTAETAANYAYKLKGDPTKTSLGMWYKVV